MKRLTICLFPILMMTMVPSGRCCGRIKKGNAEQTEEDRRQNEENRRQTKVVHALVRAATHERPLLLQIAQCDNSISFQKLDEKQVKSAVGRMIYAAKFYEFAPHDASVMVLESLPKSDLQMQALSEFIFMPGNETFRPLGRQLYSAMFKSVAEHPEYIDSVFEVAGQFDSIEWFDVEDGEWFCGQMGPLQHAMPDQFQSAVKRLNPKDRASLEACVRYSNAN